MMRRLHIAALGFAASILSASGDQVLPMVTNSADVSFSTDGKTLAVLGWDNQVRFWDLATARVTRTLGPEASDAFCFLLPSGNQLLTISTNRALRIRDTVSGGILSSFAPPDSRFDWDQVVTTADGALLAASCTDPASPSSSIVQVIDRSGLLRFQVPAGLGGLAQMAFSPDGETLIAASWDTDIRVWDVRAGTLKHVIEEVKLETFDLAYSPDGKYLATLDADSKIYLWDTRSWKLTRKFTVQPNANRPIGFSPDGTILVTWGVIKRKPKAEPQVIVWDIASGRQIRAWTTQGRVGLSFSPDGRQLAVADGSKNVKLLAVSKKGSVKGLALVTQ
jgi:WD40 repeat protein